MMTRTDYKRYVLLGIQISPFKTNPIINIDNWRIYDAGKLPVENPHRNLNFQIERNDKEKIVLRIYLNEGNQISHAKYYFLKGGDKELSYYLCMSVINRFSNKYPLSSDFVIKQINY